MKDAKGAAKYIGSYLARPAIAAYRIEMYDGEKVHFAYEDYQTGERKEVTWPVYKFSFKLEKDFYIMKDTDQFLKCTEKLRDAIENGEIPKEFFTIKQLAQINDGLPRIDGLVWHHHQVPGKMQLVIKEVHNVNHLGGNSLWGAGIR